MIRPLATALSAIVLVFGTCAAVISGEPAPPPPDAPSRLPPQHDESGSERARAAPRDRDGDARGGDRDRPPARMADPRFQGLERARAAARGADPGGGVDCLSARDARSATLQKRAVSLSEAVRVARDAWDGEVIDYKLCTYDGRLAYELTLLNTNGRVARVRVDASNGKLVGVR